MRKPRIAVFLALVIAAILVPRSHAQEADPYELQPINYSATQPHDVITHLQTELVSGQLKLQGADRQVVEALLRALHISRASQMLVFSKTSFQSDRNGRGVSIIR